MVKRKGKVDGEFIKNAARIAFTECGACRRCSMYCPFGIDISYLIMLVRRICSLLGVVPQYLQDTTNSHAVTMNQMWVQQDEWVDTLMWQEEDARGEVPRPYPADKEVPRSCTGDRAGT
jgi:Fe-S oxidoreductase